MAAATWIISIMSHDFTQVCCLLCKFLHFLMIILQTCKSWWRVPTKGVFISQVQCFLSSGIQWDRVNYVIGRSTAMISEQESVMHKRSLWELMSTLY